MSELRLSCVDFFDLTVNVRKPYELLKYFDERMPAACCGMMVDLASSGYPNMISTNYAAAHICQTRNYLLSDFLQAARDIGDDNLVTWLETNYPTKQGS